MAQPEYSNDHAGRTNTPAAAQAGFDGDLGALPEREGALLELQGLVGNQAVSDLMELDARGQDAGAEIDGMMQATGATHPVLQRASAVLRRRAPGLFGTTTHTPAPRAAGIPEFATESAHVLNSGTVKPAKHDGFPATMGQTAYERGKIEIWPSFNVTYGTPFWHWLSTTATPRKTTAQGGDWWAIATPANEAGYKMPDGRAEYPGFDYYIKVSAKAAGLIAKAEQQHINDLDQGWAITGAATASAINAASEEEPDVMPSQGAAKQAAVDRVAGKLPIGDRIKGGLRSGGRLEDTLAPLMDGAFQASGKFRDKSNKHTIPIKFTEKDDKQKKVVYEVDDGFSLDETSSESVVNAGTI